MNISDVRLTLYALLSSIEADLRQVIRTEILPQKSDLSFIKNKVVQKKICERYLKAHSDTDPNKDLIGILYYLNFDDSYHILRENAIDLSEDFAKELRDHVKILDQLTGIRNRVMHSRPLLSGDFEKVYAFVTDVINSSCIEWSSCIKTITRLSSEPTFVLGLTLPSIRDEDLCISHNLPVPDFDDTGFVGRSKDVTEIKKLLLGPNTVVSLIGEGGVGKTAILLKILYDIVDMGEKCPFDAIIWMSAKATVLTPTGIEEIKNTISDISGMVTTIGNELGVSTKNTQSNINEILEYLEEFNILLALDNVETIISSDIRDFIKKAQFHCKIAITSRVGLGELEFPWHLSPMDDREAKLLFKAHSRIRNQEHLLRLSDKQLKKILNQLHFNPLAIKWFVQSVQSGKSPSEVITLRGDVLTYCMTNVFEQLSETSHSVLNAMLSARTHTSEAELIYYTNLPALDVRKAINDLLATSFLLRKTRKKSDSEELVYFVSDFAREYLIKTHPPSTTFVQEIQRKLNQLKVSVQETKRIGKLDMFSVNALSPRNRSERAVSPLLRQALTFSQKHNYEDALKKTNEALIIISHYYEIYLIAAFVKASKGDLLGAEDDYKIALDFEPDNPRVLYFYAGFLMRHMKDGMSALPYAQKAYTLCSNSVETATLFARCVGYNGDYPKALELLHYLLDSKGILSVRNKKVITTLTINFHRRFAEDNQRITKDYVTAIKSIQIGLSLFSDSVRDSFVDERIILELVELIKEYKKSINKLCDSSEAKIFELIVRDHKEYLIHAGYEYLINMIIPPSTKINDEIEIGVGSVIQCSNDREYAFIKSQQNERFFFHKHNLAEDEKWSSIHDDALVRFEIGEDSKGAYARNVQVIDKLEHKDRSEKNKKNNPYKKGVIVELYPERTYAFIESGRSNRYYFSRTSLSKNIKWESLSNKTPVTFRLGKNLKGECAIDLSLCEELNSHQGEPKKGIVLEYYTDRPFAFVECSDGSRFFFHESNLEKKYSWINIKNGSNVSFIESTNKAGICADQVTLLI